MLAAQGEKRVKNLTRLGSGAYGNAATRIETFMTSGGTLSFLKDSEIDAWYAQQAVELGAKKREAILHKIQQKVYDEAFFMPIWELGFLCASGPRVAVSGLEPISAFIYPGPDEDVRLKASAVGGKVMPSPLGGDVEALSLNPHQPDDLADIRHLL
jgi:peptide/nickel transport system substrate-binding protein